MMVDSIESQMSLIDCSYQYQELALRQICDHLEEEEDGQREDEIQKIKTQLLQNIRLEAEVKARFPALQATAEKLKAIPDLEIEQVPIALLWIQRLLSG